MCFFRKGARRATPEQMEGRADQYVHMAWMISPTFLSGTNSFFFFFLVGMRREGAVGQMEFPYSSDAGVGSWDAGVGGEIFKGDL